MEYNNITDVLILPKYNFKRLSRCHVYTLVGILKIQLTLTVHYLSLDTLAILEATHI